MNYPIGDFLIKIKNASLGGKREIVTKNTKLIEAVAKSLKARGYLTEVKKDGQKLIVKIAYMKKRPVLLDIKLISKPGLRVYWGVDELEKKKGPSSFIFSTPKGIIFSDEAIKKRIGGEVIAEVF